MAAHADVVTLKRLDRAISASGGNGNVREHS